MAKGTGYGHQCWRAKSWLRQRHKTEWAEIASWWGKAPMPPEAILDFFDNYVHDSRAWFKFDPDAPDSEERMVAQLAAWEAQRKRVAEENARDLAELQKQMKWMSKAEQTGTARLYKPKKDGLTDDQRAAAEEYGRTNKIPRMVNGGREPFDGTVVIAMAGYLRFRKIYAGADALLISGLPPGDDDTANRA